MDQLLSRLPNVQLLSHAFEACVVGVVIADAQQSDFPVVYVNPAFERLTGYPANEVIGRNCRFLQGQDRNQIVRDQIRQAFEQDQGVIVVLRNYRKDGSMFYNELTLSPIHDVHGTLTHYLGFQNDVTAREEARQREEQAREQLRATLSHMTDGFMSFDRDWNFTYVNQAAAQISGRQPKDFNGLNLLTAFPEMRDLAVGQAATQAVATGRTHSAVSYLPEFDRWVELTVYPGDDGLSIFTRDVTDSQRAQRELQISQERFSKVFEYSPVAIFITRQRDKHFLNVNKEFVRQSGYTYEEIIGRSSAELSFWTDQADRQVAWSMVDDGRPIHNREVIFRKKMGDEIYGLLSTFPVDLDGEACVIGFVHDITKEKLARQRLEASEQYAKRMATEFQYTLDLSLDLIVSIGPDHRFSMVSAASSRILGYEPEEMIGHLASDFIHPDDQIETWKEGQKARAGQSTTTFQNCYLRKDGTKVCLEWSVAPLPGSGVLYCVGRDVTQRQAAEEDRAFLAAIVQASRDAIIGLSLDGRIRSWNPGAKELYGYTADEVIGHPVTFLMPSELQDQEEQLVEQAKQGALNPGFESRRITKGGKSVLVFVTISPILNLAGRVIGVSKIAQDITAFRAAEQQIQMLNGNLQQQLRHVTGMRAIDQSITSGNDLSITLGMVLDNIRQQLNIDVVTILLFDPPRKMLTYVNTRGFYTAKLEKSEMRLGVGLAGRVAQTRQPLSLPDLASVETAVTVLPAWRKLFQDEGLRAYYALPLLSKGQLVGVIEVLHHEARPLSLERLTILETLADQAAIAIDNARLVQELERSNAELRSAYDETIEGWAKALDLRDKETEGHSRRVTEMTVELCQALGFTPEQLLVVRRGALLHDIGKMGIPDTVLLKPGKLTDEEWLLMKRHPQYAVDLLSPIEFLQPALDIPHYHHEKWDGSGYPLGLKGPAIPLSARAFAIVDVYDALTSDRPYRKAWTREQALAHIKEGSGTHFDSEVVEVFMQLLQQA